MTINERMFKIMEEKYIKPTNLANTLEISKSVVSTWKSRGTNPPIEYVERICELLTSGSEHRVLYNRKKGK